MQDPWDWEWDPPGWVTAPFVILFLLLFVGQLLENWKDWKDERKRRKEEKYYKAHPSEPRTSYYGDGQLQVMQSRKNGEANGLYERYHLPAPGQYGMMTYMHEGKQYIVVQVGSFRTDYPGALVAYTLP